MILYIGQYRGGNDGWSEASKNYLKSLQATGFDIASRPIFMNRQRNPDGQIWNTEKPLKVAPKIVIQHVIPDYFEYMPGYNIGITFTETKRLNQHPWIYKINLLDELWVNTQAEKESLEKSGVIIKISVIPMPIDIGYLEGNIDNIEIMPIPELKDNYVFYFIGDYDTRNNIDDLVRAFNLEFTINDDVILLIKTSVSGMNVAQTQAHITEKIKNIKQTMRIHGNPQTYPREIIITQHLTNEQILSIHKTCDCFVSASYGESIAVPVLYATYMNNVVICTKGVYTESLIKDVCIAVNSTEVTVEVENPPIPHIYTSHERWMQPDIIDLRKAMRNAYKLKSNSNQTTKIGKNYITNNFSYQVTADKIKDNLSWV